MTSSEALALLPDVNGCVVILSGGMDSTIAMRLAVQKYGKENVSALTFYYGQKQKREIEMAQMSTNIEQVKDVIDVAPGFDSAVGEFFCKSRRSGSQQKRKIRRQGNSRHS